LVFLLFFWQVHTVFIWQGFTLFFIGRGSHQFIGGGFIPAGVHTGRGS
jgi:hypothetical protein